jgi:hypothetical protein
VGRRQAPLGQTRLSREAPQEQLRRREPRGQGHRRLKIGRLVADLQLYADHAAGQEAREALWLTLGHVLDADVHPQLQVELVQLRRAQAAAVPRVRRRPPRGLVHGVEDRGSGARHRRPQHPTASQGEVHRAHLRQRPVRRDEGGLVPKGPQELGIGAVEQDGRLGERERRVAAGSSERMARSLLPHEEAPHGRSVGHAGAGYAGSAAAFGQRPALAAVVDVVRVVVEPAAAAPDEARRAVRATPRALARDVLGEQHVR